MNHVEGFVGSDCVIHNVHIPVSRTRKKEFMNLLLQTSIWNDSCEMEDTMLYQDIPRIYTAIAEWGACLVYLYYLKKGKHEICTFSYRQSFHAGNAEYLSDFDGQRN